MNEININNVSKSFGKTTAVKEVSFQVNKGRVFGLLGPNGAGKTTTLRMINYIINPDIGSISIFGNPVSPSTQNQVGYLPEERGLYKKMKVGEQLIYLARLRGMDSETARKKISYWLNRLEAGDWYSRQVGELSKGMSQKIQFISTIVHEPDVYIFDEPFSGLDPINSELLKKIIIELKDQGKVILFATHRMEQVEQMCDDIGLFNKGKMVLSGDLREIKKQFGKNSIVLEFQGDGSFLDHMDHIRINNRSANFAEIRLLNGISPQSVLKSAVDAVDVHKFEMIEPSLTEIFISTVGEDNLKSLKLS